MEISVIWNKNLLAFEIGLFRDGEMISNPVYKYSASEVYAQVEKWQARYQATARYGNLTALLLKKAN